MPEDDIIPKGCCKSAVMDFGLKQYGKYGFLGPTAATAL